MDKHCNSLAGWEIYCQGKSTEELGQSLLYTALELEETKLVVQQELRTRDDQRAELEDRLAKALKERDEAHAECKRLLLENLQLQKHLQQNNAPASGMSSVEDEHVKGIDSNNGFSSSDCEESIVSPPDVDALPHKPPSPALAQAMKLVSDKPLPEKGKLLQAVMKAGPLLQTLLLAGPLPQWRHPPPPLESFEIPPVQISVSTPPRQQQTLHHELPASSVMCSNKKRLIYSGAARPNENKFQRIALH